MNQSNDVEKTSVICLDSAEVKRLREQQQLTQLYVSKVVGVTTDTISRWENNRYPTIRRENALKLAEALEVPLAAILLKPVEEIVAPKPQRKKQSTTYGLIIAAVLLVTGLIVAYSLMKQVSPVPAPVTAERILPGFAAPGSTIPVQVTLTQRADKSGLIFRENFPKGWKVIQADPPASSLDNVNGVARWILKAGDDRSRIVYLLQVDALAKPGGESSFHGEIVASNQGSQSAVAVQGEMKIVVAPKHWADTDGDGRIDDREMLEASFTIEDMVGVHIDWHDLEQLWDAGSYTWNKKQGKFVPQLREP